VLDRHEFVALLARVLVALADRKLEVFTEHVLLSCVVAASEMGIGRPIPILRVAWRFPA
jgi:hypothetical protein